MGIRISPFRFAPVEMTGMATDEECGQKTDWLYIWQTCSRAKLESLRLFDFDDLPPEFLIRPFGAPSPRGKVLENGLPGGELPEGQERPPWGAPVCATLRNDMEI